MQTIEEKRCRSFQTSEQTGFCEGQNNDHSIFKHFDNSSFRLCSLDTCRTIRAPLTKSQEGQSSFWMTFESFLWGLQSLATQISTWDALFFQPGVFCVLMSLSNAYYLCDKQSDSRSDNNVMTIITWLLSHLILTNWPGNMERLHIFILDRSAHQDCK